MEYNYFDILDFQNLEKLWKINFINSITGFKPANLIGTRSKNNLDNVAIFSSVVHLGSNPGLLGFTLRPQDERQTDTYKNLKENSLFTINSINIDSIDKAHQTSKKYSNDISEFTELNIEQFNYKEFNAPFVKNSDIKIGLKKVEQHKLYNSCILVVGKIENIIVNRNIIEDDGNINFDNSKIVCISGLYSYYKPKLIKKLDYVKS